MSNFNISSSLFNKENSEYLESIIRSNVFANGYIFYGPEGLGKKEKAIEFIKGIFKKYKSSFNIDEKIINNNHPDLFIIEPISFSESKIKKNSDSQKPKKDNADIIKISQIRSVKAFLGQKSIESKKKIVLIVDAHLLNEAASNCLLKTLEEPSNGIFILTTSNINLLSDTIKSRCQKVRFRSFSSNETESFLKANLDTSELKICKKLNFQDLINSANGSPKQLLKNVEIWNVLPQEITSKLEFPLKGNLEILNFSKLISENLEVYQHICLINLIQQMWWRKTKNKNLVKKLEHLKFLIEGKIQPRLAWEVTLLKIALEDL